jgi:hypothetical protein
MPASTITETDGKADIMSFEAGPVNQPATFGMSLRPAFDLIEVLPPGAAERLRALRQRFSDTNALTVPFATIQEASTAKITAEQRLQRLLAPRSEGGFQLRNKDDARLVEQQRLVDKLTDDLRRLNERNEARTAIWTAASHVMSACEGWLRGGVPPGCVLQDHDGEQPKLIKGESVLDAIERLRRRGRELKASIHRIESAPFSSGYAKQRMRAQIEALAMQGAPDVSDLIEHDRQIIFPTRPVQSDVVGSATAALAFAELDAAVPLIVWLHRDAIVKRLDAEIDAESDDAAALSHDERAKRLAEAQGDLLACERDEAWWVWQAQEAQGLPVEHRADCSAQAILQCMAVAAPKHTNGSGSSPEHAGWNTMHGKRWRTHRSFAGSVACQPGGRGARMVRR